MANNYQSYIDDNLADIAACIESMGCQPILFVGSGLSRRYFGGPSWEELMQKMAEQCPTIDKPLVYYKQTFKSFEAIGTKFAELYKEWAWGGGGANFPNSLFTDDTPEDAYLKFKVSEYLVNNTPKSIDKVSDAALSAELSALRAIRPHAIITTNFDNFIEGVFPDYEPVIGQQILRHQYANIGEIYKIHGCVRSPESIVLTKSDYDEFITKKKYLSAKLLAFFAEHPLLFIGYSASDKNIKAILSDIDEILSPNGELIPNIYLIEWEEKVGSSEYPLREKLISIGSDKTVRIKNISTSSFKWIFDAFAANESAIKVSPKLLRALVARTYDLVRHDIPRRTIEIDFKLLEHAVSSTDEMAKVYGITTLDNPSALNANFPYTLTDVGITLGGKGWHCAQKILEKIVRDTGADLKSSDNKYHVGVKSGKVMVSHKYSELAIELFKKVASGSEYSVVLD